MPKKKRKLKRGFIFILLIVLIGFFSYLMMKNFIGFEIKNIYIFNNNLLSDQEVIELAKISNYPNFYTTLTSKIKKNLKTSSYIKDVKVQKKFFQEVHIYVEEYQVLFLNNEDNTYILDNGSRIERDVEIVDVPVLINYVPDEKLSSLINKFKEIDEKVRSKISEIRYHPNEYDEDRFLLYMNDENYVYVTLTKLDLLNKYNETVEQLEGKKGILYLDSGNYFEIMD